MQMTACHSPVFGL